jgi:hypothetical protein
MVWGPPLQLLALASHDNTNEVNANSSDDESTSDHHDYSSTQVLGLEQQYNFDLGRGG